jgi:hypothetical protein
MPPQARAGAGGERRSGDASTEDLLAQLASSPPSDALFPFAPAQHKESEL